MSTAVFELLAANLALLLYHIDLQRSLPWLEVEDARTMQRSQMDTLLYETLVVKLQSSLP